MGGEEKKQDCGQEFHKQLNLGEPLFVNQYVYTKEIYRELIQRIWVKTEVIFLAGTFLFLFCMTVTESWNADFGIFLVEVVSPLLMIFLAVFWPRIQSNLFIKNNWERYHSRPAVSVCFFDNGILTYDEQTDGKLMLYYDRIRGILRTGNLYLLRLDAKGYIVLTKTGFVQGTAEQFDEFIHKKMDSGGKEREIKESEKEDAAAEKGDFRPLDTGERACFINRYVESVQMYTDVWRADRNTYNTVCVCVMLASLYWMAMACFAVEVFSMAVVALALAAGIAYFYFNAPYRKGRRQMKNQIALYREPVQCIVYFNDDKIVFYMEKTDAKQIFLYEDIELIFRTKSFYLLKTRKKIYICAAREGFVKGNVHDFERFIQKKTGVKKIKNR